jgi:hypothetical protein
MQVMHDMAVDVDKIASVAALSDAVNSPDFVDQRAAHVATLLLANAPLFARYAPDAWLVNALAPYGGRQPFACSD